MALLKSPGPDVNSHVFGSFCPQWGLCQGDPLSPYLYILCTEDFNSLLDRSALEETVPGVAICRGAPLISHLVFIDDTFIFSQANETVITQMLMTYARASGQGINFSKLTMVFSKNVERSQKDLIPRVLGIRKMNQHGLYLGLSAIVGKSEPVVYKSLREKLE
ncbi:UNVERIFIED_CONTAM: putative mitochondrial protein [Sesamum latifolium]|uniref:Mitochondrial protein n=1 Tax=Sesamum latifolium TaxID=2727402 RepID=A0AAW2XCB7_9LAMI